MTWDGFSPPSGAVGTQYFFIYPTSTGQTVFYQDSLAPETTSLVLPADTLAPNTNYGFRLGYINEVETDTGFDTANGVTYFHRFTGGFFTTGGSIPGTTPGNPLLPTPNPGNPGFTFPGVPVVPGQPIFFDPDVAVGYDYSVTGGPLFASVLIPNALPNGDSNFILELPGFGNFSFLAGTSFDLLGVNPLGFSNFRISDIDIAEMLDPTNPTAFVTGLTFTTAGTVDVTQNPVVQNIASTPEPSSLFGLGLLGLGFMMGGKKRSHEQ